MESQVSEHVPPRYDHATFENWIPQTAHDPRPMLRQWMASAPLERPWCLTFLGPAGTGKTHLASATFKAWGRWGWWLDAVEAISLMREEAANPPERATTVEKKLLDPRLLLIDDFGCTRMTEFAHEKWMYALCQRYNHRYPTIITTNAESVEAFDLIDPRVTSRLHEGLIVTLAGRDRRAA